MNRKVRRDLAAVDIGLRTAPFKYAKSVEELEEGEARFSVSLSH